MKETEDLMEIWVVSMSETFLCHLGQADEDREIQWAW